METLLESDEGSYNSPFQKIAKSTNCRLLSRYHVKFCSFVLDLNILSLKICKFDIVFLIVDPTRGPNVTRVHDVTSTSMNITWNMLSMGDSNGKIIQYRVCYKASDKLSNITLSDCIFNQDVFGADNTTTVLSNLNEATTYIIAVKARTKAGFGSLGPAISNTTLEDSK